ncbi:hypothetical protein [Micromonospora halophytica]|uniref:Cell wall-active antibiotics response LiaF-like C-terminal domain-containing protein n=1 Tax=Micromonospora halophytica TaxID=47864 RepID=A0A1C5HV59_9ACTN|nr:hypothetical protein [Micromonospora halophytica]SCG49906.1 hypothetical protein GA0070560_10695 [Micromonospora halophytica]
MAEPDRSDRPTAGEAAGHTPPAVEPTGASAAPVVQVTGEPADEPPHRSPWQSGARLLAAAAIMVLALGALAVTVTLANPDRLGVAFSGARPTAPTVAPAAPGRGGTARAAAAEQALTAPLAGRRRATFELADGLTSFRLRTGDLGDDLYQISSPADSGVLPRPELLGERVQVRLVESGRAGRGVVDVVLTSRVTWRLRLVGGVSEHLLDLSSARLSGVEVIGGAARIDLRLPETRGTLTVRMTGGVDQFVVHAPGRPPVRVRAGSGAGGVTVYDDRRDGVGPGEIISSPNWDRSVGRVYVDLVAGAHTVTVRAA